MRAAGAMTILPGENLVGGAEFIEPFRVSSNQDGREPAGCEWLKSLNVI